MNLARVTHRDPGFRFADDEAEELGSSLGWRSLAADSSVPASGSIRPPLGLGDWVETWAKPTGCVIDRCTAKFPEWLVKVRPFKGLRLIRPKPKPKRWSWAWMAGRLSRQLNRIPVTRYWPLPHQLRTGFCKGTCGCTSRKHALNRLVPDLRHPFARLQARF